jgi:hypothetical protein
MNIERIKQLEKWVGEDPTDPFNKYGLALEVQHIDRLKADGLFSELLTHHKDYLPTYYTAAQFYADYDNRKAIAILEQGIALAKILEEPKAVRELQSALDQLLF